MKGEIVEGLPFLLTSWESAGFAASARATRFFLDFFMFYRRGREGKKLEM